MKLWGKMVNSTKRLIATSALAMALYRVGGIALALATAWQVRNTPLVYPALGAALGNFLWMVAAVAARKWAR